MISADHTVTFPNHKESEPVTKTDSAMTIFHHHNIINVLISHFLIMTLLVHLHQLQTNTQNTSLTHTQSHLGASERHLISLCWVLLRMKKLREFLIHIFSPELCYLHVATEHLHCGWSKEVNSELYSIFMNHKFKFTKRDRLQVLENFHLCLQEPGFVNPLSHMQISLNLNTDQVILMKI